MSDLRVSAAGPEEMSTILALRGVVFPEEELDKQDPRYFRWAFESGPEGPARFYIARDGAGRVAGSYTVVPQRFASGDAEIPGSIVVDVMTHPDFRKRGVFTTLGRAAMVDNVRLGVAFACGYPVRPEVMPGHLNIGWRELFPIPVVVRPLDLGALARRFLPRTPSRLVGALASPVHLLFAPKATGAYEELGEIRPGLLSGLGADVGELWRRTRSRAPIQHVRDAAYLEWRYAGHPTRRYRAWALRGRDGLDALVVTGARRIRRYATHAVADMLAVEGEAGDAALADLLRRVERTLAGEGGSELMIAMSPPGSRVARVLRRAGFIGAPGAIIRFILYPSSSALAPAVRDDSSSWYLAWGDTDDV